MTNRRWPSRDEFAQMSAEALEAFLRSIGANVRVTKPKKRPQFDNRPSSVNTKQVF